MIECVPAAADASHSASGEQMTSGHRAESYALARPAIISMLAALDFVAGGGCIPAAILLLLLADRIGVLALLGATLLFASGGLCLACGRGLWKLKRYGRVLQIGFSWFGLLGVPFGTLMSVLLLRYLRRPEIKALFSGERSSKLTAEEVAALTAVTQTAQTTTGRFTGMVMAVLLVGALNIAGIISAFAVPNMMSAMERVRQRKAVQEILVIANAAENYYLENDAYPPAASFDELISILVPKYVKSLPREDAWRHAYRYQAWPQRAASDYAIGSAGRDGIWQREALDAYPVAVTESFDCDLVYKNGLFVQHSEGMQSR
jgi:type II secretory pathway pseudopilin PulG